MNKTKIEWCDMTWNPVTGCKQGCEYCYARRIAVRFMPFDLPHLTEDGVLKGINDLTAPVITVCKDGKERICAYPYGFEPTMHLYRLTAPARQPNPQTIFVCSMADLFGDWVPDSWIEAVFDACKKAPRHRYMFLTKNPKRYADLANAGKLPRRRDCPNFWYGTSVTKPGDKAFTVGVTYNTFLSIEPLLEPLHAGLGSFGGASLIIIGAESGNRQEKVTPQREWVDNICEAAGITHAAVFMKDSLLPIVGAENMRRELPWEVDKIG